ncbi:MAG TPA: SHOCT domain-containing protein [Symbiobacteriaceae bacterium]|jgi:uncharacterized membrane protein
MMLMWIIPLVLVLAFLLPNKGQRLSKWTWALVALFALPFVGMLLVYCVGGFGGPFGGRYGGPLGSMMGPGGGAYRGPGFPGGPMGSMMGPGFGYGYGYGGAGAWVGMALVLVGIGLVAYFLYKRSKAAPDAAPEAIEGDDALRHLRMRLAKGEISPEDFDVLQQKLKG